jgi:hypothetical protein
MGFGYFFPTSRAFGERITWERDELSEGRDVLKCLVDLVVTGCFCFTTDAGDVKYSDYLTAYGDADALAEAARKKVANAANAALAPFRELRRESIGEGFEKEEE